MIKQIMIPVAAFAFTVTAASAFNSDRLDQIDVDLSDTQVAALEEAHELREDGATRDEVHAVLEEAGLDQEAMEEIRTAMHELRDERHEAVEEAVKANDYDAFVAAIAGTPLADVIDSEADFDKFVDAYELREAGDYTAAREIMDELGIERGAGAGHGGQRGDGVGDKDRLQMHDKDQDGDDQRQNKGQGGSGQRGGRG